MIANTTDSITQEPGEEGKEVMDEGFIGFQNTSTCRDIAAEFNDPLRAIKERERTGIEPLREHTYIDRQDIPAAGTRPNRRPAGPRLRRIPAGKRPHRTSVGPRARRASAGAGGDEGRMR
jgi:hypothetical protein